MDGGRTDAGLPDAGSDDGGDVDPDSGVRGEGLSCTACETNADCATDHYCGPVAGGSVCLARCNIDLPDCPPRFECVMNFTGSIPFPVCAPVGERCCVDFDGDLHGTGVGCLGDDCNDDDGATNSSASEICDGQDNDCNGTVDDGDQDVLCPRGEHVAETMCAGGMCEIGGCEPNFADCNRTAADGCEVSTTGAGDCGMCGTPCVIPNGTPDCSSGACRVGGCDPGFGDCNGLAMDGCEQPLNTLGHCGACGNGCDLPRASETCGSGTCEIASCESGFGDCDGNDASGCETSTRTNADCGSCGRVCSPANANGDCSTGTCRVSSCLPGYGDCNTDGTSCETRLNTTTHCGSCGNTCVLPNANETCTTGSCQLSSCLNLFSNCDGLGSNGCEVSHRAVNGVCGNPGAGVNYVGEEHGDVSCGCCGFVCSECCGNPQDSGAFAVRTGTTSAWFTARALEGSSCAFGGSLHHQIRLQSPPGVDYDLFVYRGCGSAPVDSSVAGAGALDTVDVTGADDLAEDDHFYYYVEVRHVGSGESCEPWTLRFFGHHCE